MVAKIIEENSKAIEKLNKEISKLENQDLKIEASKHEVEKAETKPKDKEKRCRYYNKGYCKYVGKCRYFHANEICQRHLENLKCSEKNCNKRHSNQCKWFQKEVGCRRSNCDFLHETLACDDGNKNAHKETKYKCEGCKSEFPKDNYVVKHTIQNMELWFCLNCDDFIKDKSKVLNNDWILFDQNGDLRRDV